MKRFLFFALFLLPLISQAVEPGVSFNLDRVKVMELAELVYGDVTKQNYAVDTSVLDIKDQISIHIQDLDKKQVVSVLESLLSSSGVEIDKSGKVIFLRAKKPDEKNEALQNVFFYKSRYRPVSYLVDLTSSLFKTGRFSVQRGVKSVPDISTQPLGAGAGAAVGPAATMHQQKKPVQDSGSSAYSQIDKSEQDSFVFQGTEQEISLLQKLLVQIDTPVGEVLVKGTVYEVTTSEKDGSAFGLALSLMQGKFGLTIGKNSPVGDSVTFKSASIDAVFSALSTDSRFKSISNPSLRVKSGSNARFSVGSDVPVLGAVQLDRNGNPIQSVEYKPSGVIFDLKPQIRDAVIDLTINQQLSSFIPTTSGVNNSPTLIKREISTSIGAANDDVIVLGGLDEEKNSQDNSGFSFLPAWMKSRGGENSKTQILLVLQVQKI